MKNSDRFARRTRTMPRSFIREILKVTEQPDIISFAGGLPSPDLFPVAEFAEAAAKVLADHGSQALQYSTTEGYLPLREQISRRYFEKKGLRIGPDEILITNGSQEALDLVGKIFLDPGDAVVLERPAYLGAIQAFSAYEPAFHAVPLLDDGIDLARLEATLDGVDAKLLYAVPNFQNPSGITYSRSNRAALARIAERRRLLIVEDDPYGELRFHGEELPTLKSELGGDGILLGTFSKIVAPGIRLGWVCASTEIMQRLVTAKQGSDLHTSYLSQRVLTQYLTDHDLDAHIAAIRTQYGRQRDAMVRLLETHCPPGVRFTRPDGGMFLWITLPEGVSARTLFDRAIEQKVAFVPGNAFYVDGGGAETLRLNFSNCDLERIERGIVRLSVALRELLGERPSRNRIDEMGRTG